MKKLTSFVLMAVFAASLCGAVAAQERGEHRRGGEQRGTEKRSEQVERFSRIRKAVSEGKMTREEAAKKLMQLREKMGSKKDSKKSSKRGSEKPVVGRKGCECSCHKKATKKSERRTQERRRGRGRGRTEGRRSGGSRWGRGRTLHYRWNRA